MECDECERIVDVHTCKAARGQYGARSRPLSHTMFGHDELDDAFRWRTDDRLAAVNYDVRHRAAVVDRNQGTAVRRDSNWVR